MYRHDPNTYTWLLSSLARHRHDPNTHIHGCSLPWLGTGMTIAHIYMAVLFIG